MVSSHALNLVENDQLTDPQLNLLMVKSQGLKFVCLWLVFSMLMVSFLNAYGLVFSMLMG